jgi:hypothetical protein
LKLGFDRDKNAFFGYLYQNFLLFIANFLSVRTNFLSDIRNFLSV